MPAQNPTYDLMLLLDTSSDEEQRSKVLAEAERILETNSASVVSKHDWGVRRTAFEIRHKNDAEYHLLQFQGPPAVLDALNRTLHITDGVTRYRIIKLRPGTPPAPDVRPETPAPRAAEEDSEAPAEPAEPTPAA
jgi:small subunit ribosomal protein S6